MLGGGIDGLITRLASRSLRRGLTGEPIWLAVALAAWLVMRSRKKGDPIVWSGSLKEGDRLLISNLGNGKSTVVEAD
jgi:hypothetical protein